MAVWPAIGNPTLGGIEETSYSPVVKMESEANYVQVRPRTTRVRKRWKLSWNAMSEVTFQILRVFFETYQGQSFSWTHPITAITYTCVFSEDSLNSTQILNNYRSVSVNIEEL